MNTDITVPEIDNTTPTQAVTVPGTSGITLDDTKVPKVFLSVNEFCSAVGIGRSLFYEELGAGRLKAKKCGKRTLIPVSELEEWPKRLPNSEAGEVLS